MKAGPILPQVARATQPLSNISRFSRDFCLKDESVLEHIGFVVLYCFAISERLKAKGYDIDQLKLLRRAAIHDIDEAGTGDINRVAKYSSEESRSGLEKFALLAAEDYSSAFGPEALDDWLNDKSDDIEGEIMRVADLASVVQKVDLELNQLGNRTFVRVAEELRSYIEEAMKAVNAPDLKEELFSFFSFLPQKQRGGLR